MSHVLSILKEIALPSEYSFGVEFYVMIVNNEGISVFLWSKHNKNIVNNNK